MGASLRLLKTSVTLNTCAHIVQIQVLDLIFTAISRSVVQVHTAFRTVFVLACSSKIQTHTRKVIHLVEALRRRLYLLHSNVLTYSRQTLSILFALYGTLRNCESRVGAGLLASGSANKIKRDLRAGETTRRI